MNRVNFKNKAKSTVPPASLTGYSHHLQSNSLPRSSPNGVGSAGGNSLMNSSGQIIYRRSPTLYNTNNNNNNNHSTNANSFNSTAPESYETLEISPSITTTCNTSTSYLSSADELGEIMISHNSSMIVDEDEHVKDLNQKYDVLQKKIDILTENQATQDERYRRTRQENDLLLTKIHSLEDQLRDLELSSENHAKEDEKRFKETMAKYNRVQQECEQHMKTIIQLQEELCTLQNDLIKNESLIKSLRFDKQRLELELSDRNNELNDMDNEIHKLKLLTKQLQEEDDRKENIISILNEELEESQNKSLSNNDNTQQQTNNHDLSIHNTTTANEGNSPKYIINNIVPSSRFCSSPRTSLTSGFEEEFISNVNQRAMKDFDGLEMNLCQLREENQQLKQLNEELQGQLLNAQLEEGRCLVQEGNKSYSLADEMGDINVERLMKALNEQQEDNARLRRYVDQILIKVLERNPEILDTTQTESSSKFPKKSGNCSETTNIPTI